MTALNEVSMEEKHYIEWVELVQDGMSIVVPVIDILVKCEAGWRWPLFHSSPYLPAADSIILPIMSARVIPIAFAIAPM